MHLGTLRVEKIGMGNKLQSYYAYKPFSGLLIKHPVFCKQNPPLYSSLKSVREGNYSFSLLFNGNIASIENNYKLGTNNSINFANQLDFTYNKSSLKTWRELERGLVLTFLPTHNRVLGES